MSTAQRQGTLLGERYRIGEELGRGGMAAVYRARDESLGREVAIKVLTHGLTDPDGIARHHEEVHLLASLNHPCLVTLHDAVTDETADLAYLVTEFVSGEDLRTRLGRGPLPAREAASIGRDLASGLAYIHSRGVIHRDIKPANILLLADDDRPTGPVAKLADFGIARIVDGARITSTGTIIGTASYFSPEQALGEPLTGASDVYSLGLVLLEGLTGVRTFPGSAAESAAARLTRNPEIPDGLGRGWAALLRQMTHREPEARPTGVSLVTEFETLMRDGTPGSTPVGPTATETATDDAAAVTATMPYPATQIDPVDARSPHGTGVTTAEGEEAAAVAAPSLQTDSSTGPRAKRRRLGGVVAAVAAAILAATAAAIVWFGANEPRLPEPPNYPVVDGELGERLRQLQRSVQP